MPFRARYEKPLTPAEIIRQVEESNARPGLKFNICVWCKLRGEERTAYPLDQTEPDNYTDHMKTHNQGGK